MPTAARGDARDRLERYIASLDDADNQLDTARALECLGRAYTDLGDWEAALATADRGLALATRRDRLPLAWRFRGCRSYALEQLGRASEAAEERERAAADFDTLTGRIADPALRRWFVRQPLARRWLGRSGDDTSKESGS